jgi:hypothetical protein
MTNRTVPPYVLSLAVALFWLAPIQVSIADECAPLASKLTADAAQQLFHRGPNNEWLPVPDEGLALTTSKTHLLYVARNFLTQPRTGAVVVKTGRGIQAGEFDPTPIDKRIKLRRVQQAEFESCRGKEPPFFKNQISAAEYDRFHDYGYDASNDIHGNMLAEFHTRYVGRSGGCNVSTDNASFDAPFRWDWRSNRSQFSFHEGVVAGGFFSQILAGARFGRAAAVGSIGLANQRVEIIKYRASAGKIACIPIQVKLTGRNFFIRVNDLESASKGSEVRVGELSRQLTR